MSAVPAAAGERLTGAAFGLGWALARRTPEPWTGALLASSADLVWRRRGAGVRRLEANLARAVPDSTAEQLRELSRAALRSYFRYWHEVFRVSTWSHRRIQDAVVTANEPPLRDALSSGRGAVVSLPHMGNWDLAGAWACLNGMPVSAVAERLRPQSLFDRFVGYREELGMEVIALTGDVNPMSALVRALAAGRLVCLVADRDLTRSGVATRLLDEPARLPGGPATLARVTGAPLFALTLAYRGPLLHLQISDPIPVQRGRGGVAAMTQQVADHFSAGIRRDPQDWHMLQPVFEADLAAAS